MIKRVSGINNINKIRMIISNLKEGIDNHNKFNEKELNTIRNNACSEIDGILKEINDFILEKHSTIKTYPEKVVLLNLFKFKEEIVTWNNKLRAYKIEYIKIKDVITDLTRIFNNILSRLNRLEDYISKM